MGLTKPSSPPSEHLYIDLDGDGVYETDVSSYLKSVQVGYGRDSALDSFKPRQLLAVLDNTGSEFSPRNLDSPYWPDLKRGRQVQQWTDLLIEQVVNLLDNPSVEVDDDGYGDASSAVHIRADAGFFDGFDEDTSADFAVTGGTWTWGSSAPSQVEGGDAGGPHTLYRKDFVLQNGWVEAVISQAEDNCGIVIRWISDGTNYFLRIHDDAAGADASTVRLYKRIVGSDTALGVALVPITFTRGKPHVFRLEVQGDTFKIYVDGSLVDTVVDSTLSLSGRAGVRVNDATSSYFHSIQVHNLDYQARFSKSSVRYTADNSDGSGMVLTLRNGDRVVTPIGHSAVFVAWVRTAVGVGSKIFQANLAIYDAVTGGTLKETITKDSQIVGEVWTQVFVAGTITATNASHTQVVILTDGAQGEFDFFVDGCMLYETDLIDGASLPSAIEDVEPYCDGGQALCTWDGIAYQSTSRRPAGPKLANIFENPSAEVDLNGWVGRGGTRVRDSGDARYGSYQVKQTFTSTSQGINFRLIDNSTRMSVTGGEIYVFSIFIRSDISRPYKIWIEWYDSGGSWISAQSVAFTVDTKWRRFFFVKVAPSNAVTAQPQLINQTSDADAVYMDGANFVEATELFPYIDGGQKNVTWDGTAHASTSQRTHIVKQFTGKIREFEFSRWLDDTPVVELTATGKMETLTNNLMRAGPFTRKPAKWVLQRMLDLLTAGQVIKDAANRYWGDDMVSDPTHLGCSTGASMDVNITGKGGVDPEEYGAIEGDNIKYAVFVGGANTNGCGWRLDVTSRSDETGTYRAAIWLATNDSESDGLDVRFALENQSGTERVGSTATLVLDGWVYVEIEGTFQAGDTTRLLVLYNNDVGWDSTGLLPDYFWDGLQFAPAANTLPLNFSGKWWDEDIEYMDAYFRSANAILEELAKSSAGWFFEDEDGNLVFEDITARSPNVVPDLRLSDAPNDGAPYAVSKYKEPVTGLYTGVKVGSFGDITLLPGDGRLVWNLEPMPKVIGANGEMIYRAAFAGEEGDALVGRSAGIIKNISAGGFGNDPEGSGIVTPILLNYGRAADVVVVAGGSGVTIDLLSIEARVQNRSTSERSFVQESVPGDEVTDEERMLELDTPAQGHQTTLMVALARWAAEKYGKGPIAFDTALNGTSLQSILEIIAVSPGMSVWVKHMTGQGAYNIDSLFFVEKAELLHEVGSLPVLDIVMEEA